MTDPEMRLTCAEWCGWRVEICGAAWILRRPDNTVASSGHRADHDIQSLSDYAKTWTSEVPWPNYPADLNAMHEAVMRLKSLDGLEWTDFNTTLIRMCGGYKWDAINATARQRAEALLRTIGRWKD